MSGCYGNSPEDKYFESKLLDHLDTCDEDTTCSQCGAVDEKGENYRIHGEWWCEDCLDKE